MDAAPLQGYKHGKQKDAGLQIHRGTNNSSLFLSYHEQADALDNRKRDAPAFEYPVWQHVPFEATMFQGRGGFDFSNL